MAKKLKSLTRERLSVVRERVLHGGDCLERIAFEWGYTLEALKESIEATYDGGRKNSQYKAIIQTSERNASRIPKEELESMQVSPKKPTSIPKKKATESTTTSTTVPEPAATPTPEDPMEVLLRKKEEFLQKKECCDYSLKEAKEVYGSRMKELRLAEDVLEKAKVAVQKAEAEFQKAEAKVQQAQVQLADMQKKLQLVETGIRELWESSIYLIDPWYLGPLPSYGTFISTVEMEGVTLQEVPDEYMPETSLDGVLLFDYVPEYRKARTFVGLVAMYELEGHPYTLIVSDERVKELLKMYIGE